MFQDLTFLFKNPLRLRVVTYFVRQPGEWMSVADVASIVGSTRQSVSRELAQLVRFGLLTSRTQGKTKTFKVNETDELFEPLKHFLGWVTNPIDKEIVAAFKGVRGVVLIVAAGLLTNEPKSSLELLIVTKNPEDKKIDKAVKKLETCAAVPLRYAILDEDEYYDRRQAYDRLLRDVFEYEHRIVVEKGN